jgi:hypothetical protein
MEGFADISAVLAGGVYVLRARGRVVFVGAANKSMLSRIATHRNLARKPQKAWLPIQGIVFDEILIRPEHPDRVQDLVNKLIEEYKPHYNLPAPSPMQDNVTYIRRRA